MHGTWTTTITLRAESRVHERDLVPLVELVTTRNLEIEISIDDRLLTVTLDVEGERPWCALLDAEDLIRAGLEGTTAAAWPTVSAEVRSPSSRCHLSRVAG